MRVRFEPGVRADYQAALRYVAALSPSAARRVRDQVREALERLIDFPQAGRLVPEYGFQEIREVIVYPYRIFYVVRDDIVVVAFWHGRQDVTGDADPEEVTN